jgi:multiple sugar transport system permease protein
MSSVTMGTPRWSSKEYQKNLKRAGVTLALAAILAIFLLPLVYGASMSIKSAEQIADKDVSALPFANKTLLHEGKVLPILLVPQANGGTKELAALEQLRAKTTFIDPDRPDAAPIVWEGSWRTLNPARVIAPQWENYPKAWSTVDFLNLLKNTILYGLFTTLGTVCASSLVAYGFARFRFPGKKLAFIVLIATIILPPAVTLVPTYTFFFKIGWVGTWLPLIVPAFFANAYNVFLIRQFLMGIPRELDEAAKVDGAGPIRTFAQIILPQAMPALMAVILFNFFFCWNDYMGPLIYLAGHPEQNPITVGLAAFSNLYTRQTNLIQAAALISCVIPVIIFFFSQRFFMQGVVMTGVDK